MHMYCSWIKLEVFTKKAHLAGLFNVVRVLLQDGVGCIRAEAGAGHEDNCRCTCKSQREAPAPLVRANSCKMQSTL